MQAVDDDIATLTERAKYHAAEMERSEECRLQHAIQLGDVLAEVKASLGPRKFAPWVESSLANIKRTWAYMLMSIAENAEMLSVQGSEQIGIESAYKLIRGRLKAQRQDAVAESIEEQEGCTVYDLHALAASGRKYGCIYADPPWDYENQSTRAATGNHYVTMTLDDIKALPVAQLAADEAHLHLWTTNAFLRDSFDLIEAWGFEYRSILVWCKGENEAAPQIGIGNYWRVNTEYLLLGIRGGLQFAKTTAAKKARMSSWVHHKRIGHSRKPPVFREHIESVSPGPRLELFGRVAVPGWDVWGNEVERTLFAGGVNV